MRFPFYEDAPKEVISECNLCGGRELVLVGLKDRYGLEAPTAKCKGCGLVQLSLRMTAVAYREFYEGGHYRRLISEWHRRPITAASIESSQRKYAARLARWLDPHMATLRSGLLLDLGGSTGVVAEHLAYAFDLDATVVEPSAEEADSARRRGLAVAQVPLEDYDAGGNHYDLVTLCQTVDHLLDIKRDLARIRDWVAPGGKFFVDFVFQTPAKIDHPFYLTSPTMKRYLHDAGFTLDVLQPSSDGRHINVLCGVE